MSSSAVITSAHEEPYPATNTPHQLFLRYSSVVVSVAVAVLIRFPLHPVLGGKAAFVTLFPAIVYSAWIAGWGGGLLATALCTLAAAWFIIPPARSVIMFDPADQFSLLVFFLVGVAISILGHAQHRAQQRAEASTRDAERSAVQQRTFLRDVLLSVTDGRLHLCHASSDLPPPLPACGAPVPLTRTKGIADLRRQAKRAAVDGGFADERWRDLITATSEAAMNAAVHGGGGSGRVCVGPDTVQVWVEDEGTGIDVATLPQATLEKGYSSAGTLGHGMKMMLSTADRVWLLTGSTGTTVVLEQDRLARILHWLPGNAG